MGSSTAVVTPSPVILDQVKDYLGITVTTYDTQISMIATQWTAILNASIGAAYLVDSSLTGILDGGKLLCIAGQCQKILPPSLFAGSAKSVTWGNYKQDEATGKDAPNAGALNPLFEQGMDILRPYMSPSSVLLSDVAVSSTGDVAADFQTQRLDSEGNVIDHGNMGVW